MIEFFLWWAFGFSMMTTVLIRSIAKEEGCLTLETLFLAIIFGIVSGFMWPLAIVIWVVVGNKDLVIWRQK